MTAKNTESQNPGTGKDGCEGGAGKGNEVDMEKNAKKNDSGDLKKELEEARKLCEEYREEAARAKADFYNYRTRVERDRARDRVLAAECTVDALLPVLDNLDRTLEAVDDKESALFKGVAMVQRQFLSALQDLGLKAVDTDCAFDPKFHEAMAVEDVDSESKNGAILEVFYKGYMLGDKVLRAAQVKVGKKE